MTSLVQYHKQHKGALCERLGAAQTPGEPLQGHSGLPVGADRPERRVRQRPAPVSGLSFTHISLLTEVLTAINLAAIFHNTVHLFELSIEPNENTINI